LFLPVLAFLPQIRAFFSLAGYFQTLQLCLFGFAAIAVVIAYGSESFMDLLVPRLWAGVAVGYVPVLLTQEIWKTVPRLSGGFTVSCIVVSLTLSCLYLRWEIGNRMRQTPNLTLGVPLRRASVLLMIGVIAALVIGLAILDGVGESLIEVHFSGDSISHTLLSQEYSVQGLRSKIYLKMLLIFAAIALLLGVILQIFWHEKPVTASV